MVCVWVHGGMCVGTWWCVCVRTCMHTMIHVYMCAYAYVCTYVCVCVWECACVLCLNTQAYTIRACTYVMCEYDLLLVFK